MIVRDGAETLDRALSSLKGYCDEIVLCIDSRTVDDTEKIGKKHNAVISYFDWMDDFAFARNLAASRASNEWILVVDADDYFEDGKQELPYRMIQEGYNVGFIKVNTAPGVNLDSGRLYDRRILRYRFKIHESLGPIDDSKILNPAYLDMTIVHRHAGIRVEPDRNIRMLDNIVSEMPRYLFYHAKEYLFRGEYENAIRGFIRYLMFNGDPDGIMEARFNLCQAYQEIGDFVNARKQCFSILLDDDNWAPAYNALGKMDMKEKKYDEAARWFEMSLRAKPTKYLIDHSAAVTFNNWINLIRLYAYSGKKDLAKVAIEEALKLNTNANSLSNTIAEIRHLL